MNSIQLLLTDIVERVKQTKWLPLITAYAVLSGVIGPGPHFPLFHLPFIVLGLVLAFKNGFEFEWAPLLLLIYLPINILITQPDSVFSAWRRMGLFAMVFLFTSPVLIGQYIGEYRKKILMGILLICVLLGVGSFVCYFLGVNFMFNQYDGSAILNYHLSGGGFGGLLIQSISLGMISGLGMLFLMYCALRQEKENRMWYYIAITILVITVLMSASRSALFSSVTGMLMMIYHQNKENGKFIQVLMGIMLVIMLTYPLWENFTTGIETKYKSEKALGEYGTRTQKWNARIAEFSASPITGIGYASVDKKHDVVGVGGVVEPGSSWLAILSMTGIIGLALFVSILIKPFQYLNSQSTPYHALLLGLLAFICMHMIAEGYIFAGGSSLCFIVWLIIGCCNDARYEIEDDEDMSDNE